MKTSGGFATRAIHHAYDPQDNEGALTPPLHLTSTFTFETAEAGGEMFAGERQGHIYSRISNPTCDLLEQRIATLEGAEAGLALSSGMGAITAVLWTLLSPGDEVIVDKTLYGCTFAFMRHGLAKWGVTITHVDMTDMENLRAAVSDKTRVVYFETPANPNMRLVDIAAASEIAHAAGAQVVVDNTYATPYLTRPLELGADIVLHSATKYLGGHGDVVAGLVAGTAEQIAEIRLVGMKDMTGAVMAPFNAMLILRGLKTLALRMDRHCASAVTVADYLAAHPAVKSVSFPGHESFAQADVAKRQMAQPGAMIAFEVEGGLQGGIAFMNGLQMIQRAVSLGDAETLIQHPASMTHSTYTPEERAEHGISDGLIRLSVGLEDVADILADLEQALPAPVQHAAE
ncbi:MULTISPECIES: methionine gamma-lyase [unclassified Leisingera]|uniref:methionine gamma-lyase n=1 Tax=unclassified Leisingera TaxID=2614906 RepID=UPI00030F9622|nr:MULTISPECIES: methionine gamma-lyase [unclassified Leisingera]KIC24865.1 methionine gamma-lyase [Leisingera sp. ANG-S3]KIC55279.1 methionine gamma-lyase [Leisingera sp. ANG-S]KID09011.1 methionine gamma-lyase [Leisingera sp. ANG1]